MELSIFHKRSDVPIHAVMKVKSLHGSIASDDTLFEDIISSDDNLISIDFLNGKSLTESGYSKVMRSADKYYLDFFDHVDYKNIMSYLENDKSDFRVTNQYGTIVRPSISDLEGLGYKFEDNRMPVYINSEKR